MLVALMQRHRFLSEPGELDAFGPYLRIDTSKRSAAEAAEQIVVRFGLQ